MNVSLTGYCNIFKMCIDRNVALLLDEHNFSCQLLIIYPKFILLTNSLIITRPSKNKNLQIKMKWTHFKTDIFWPTILKWNSNRILIWCLKKWDARNVQFVFRKSSTLHHCVASSVRKHTFVFNFFIHILLLIKFPTKKLWKCSTSTI